MTDADFVLLLLPGSYETHVELGLALASRNNKRIVLWSETGNEYADGAAACAFITIQPWSGAAVPLRNCLKCCSPYERCCPPSCNFALLFFHLANASCSAMMVILDFGCWVHWLFKYGTYPL